MVQREDTKMSPMELLSWEDKDQNVGRFGQLKFAWQSTWHTGSMTKGGGEAQSPSNGVSWRFGLNTKLYIHEMRFNKPGQRITTKENIILG